jgi:DNA polymerase III gamma/tau subunit
LWLDPEKPYTLEDLAPLFETIAFARDEHSPFFFIISHAEWLNKSCANQLLKILEEPPVDYYFIICTSNAHAVLPTIRSRCIVVNYHATPELMHHPLCTFFIQTIQPDPLALLHLLDTSTPSENESAELIDLLLNHYYQENLKKTTASNQEKIKLLQHMLMQPPMPGSSKNIWRNLLIHWPTR